MLEKGPVNTVDPNAIRITWMQYVNPKWLRPYCTNTFGKRNCSLYRRRHSIDHLGRGVKMESTAEKSATTANVSFAAIIGSELLLSGAETNMSVCTISGGFDFGVACFCPFSGPRVKNC